MALDSRKIDSRITACPSCGTKNRVPTASKGTPTCATCKKNLPWIADATDASLPSALNTNKLVLIDLWAPWCGPCRMVAPILEKLAVRYAGSLKVVKINVDDNPQSARNYDASSIPTLVMVRDGKVVDRVIGAQPEPALAAKIDQHLAV
ncbi:MAG: thioredoxin [Candidatus Nanopelagicales bacterium]